MKIHIAIIQPERYVHSLGFLDTADYLMFWIQQQGIEVTLGKNRLRHDAINLVFGAHLGFHPQWLNNSFCTFFFNLEQIGRGGADISSAYQKLLHYGPVIDYHLDNVKAYRNNLDSVPLVPFLNAPYLNPDNRELDLADRPIDLLFFGSINAERKALIKKIEKAGLDVAVFDGPTYYKERDEYVRQAKAVINTSFYDSARFEQVRAFNVLSQGTAFISYLQRGQKIDGIFKDYVFWINEDNFSSFFEEQFGSKLWCTSAQQKFNKWSETTPQKAIANLLSILQKRWLAHTANQRPIQQYRQLVQGENAQYYQDAINISPHHFDQADLEIDLFCIQNWPWSGTSRWGQKLQIGFGQMDAIVIRRWPETSQQWRALLINTMALLSSKGEMRVEVLTEGWDFGADHSYDLKRAQVTWSEFSNQFWKAGLFDERIAPTDVKFLDENNMIVEKKFCSKFSIGFKKIATTLSERTLARMMGADFGIYK